MSGENPGQDAVAPSWVDEVLSLALNSYLQLPETAKTGLAVLMWWSWIAGPPERIGKVLAGLTDATSNAAARAATERGVESETEKIRRLIGHLQTTRSSPTAHAAAQVLLNGMSSDGYPVHLIHAMNLTGDQVEGVLQQTGWLQGALSGVAGLELRALGGFLSEVEPSPNGQLSWQDEAFSSPRGWLDGMLPYAGWTELVEKWVQEVPSAAPEIE
ncbi:MAG: hypothetical protein WD716_00825 [Fimbriimonadaceae bacterium]